MPALYILVTPLIDHQTTILHLLHYPQFLQDQPLLLLVAQIWRQWRLLSVQLDLQWQKSHLFQDGKCDMTNMEEGTMWIITTEVQHGKGLNHCHLGGKCDVIRAEGSIT